MTGKSWRNKVQQNTKEAETVAPACTCGRQTPLMLELSGSYYCRLQTQNGAYFESDYWQAN